MGALLKVRGGFDGADAMSVRGRFAQKIVDFVIFDPRSGEVVAIVELDDASHNAEKDARRDAMLNAGGHTVVRLPNKPWPTRRSVWIALQGLTVPAVGDTPVPALTSIVAARRAYRVAP